LKNLTGAVIFDIASSGQHELEFSNGKSEHTLQAEMAWWPEGANLISFNAGS
jgi:hypothetical protein